MSSTTFIINVIILCVTKCRTITMNIDVFSNFQIYIICKIVLFYDNEETLNETLLQKSNVLLRLFKKSHIKKGIKCLVFL